MNNSDLQSPWLLLLKAMQPILLLILIFMVGWQVGSGTDAPGLLPVTFIASLVAFAVNRSPTHVKHFALVVPASAGLLLLLGETFYGIAFLALGMYYLHKAWSISKNLFATSIVFALTTAIFYSTFAT